MKHLILLLLFALVALILPGQNNDIDSLKIVLAHAKEDTNKVIIYSQISEYYNYKYPDSVLDYALKGLALARRLNFKREEINILNYIGEALSTKGQYPKALEVKLNALQEAEKFGDLYLISSCQNYLGALYIKTEDFSKALANYNKAKANEAYFRDKQKFVLAMIGKCYYNLNYIDSAYYYASQAYELDLKDHTHWTVPYYLMAAIYDKKGKIDQALNFYKAGNQVVSKGALDILNGYNGMASIFKKKGNRDSAIYYAKRVVKEGMERPLYSAVLEASKILTDIYKSDNIMDSAFMYQEIMLAAKDSLFSKDNIKLIQNLTFNEQQRQQQLEQARKQAQQEYETEIKLYSLISGSIVLLLIAFILYRNNRHKQKAYALLQKQKQEIGIQKSKVEKTLEEVKSTQSQLIQSEKMASLGELTAGVAHEIQNPLNFVNNFSDVNKEMLEELKAERLKPNAERDDTLQDELINDVIDNSEKISHHGKRAGDIVKGMLQHSRSSTGVKEPTDINKLADEYLRLSYHGLRAKDKTFNPEMKTDFDNSIGKINIVPQDIGRVLLNLYNNAFYAVQQKQRELAEKGLPTFERLATLYEPTVWVSTKKVNEKVVLTVKDNGNGIPQKVVDKIFQPFFTTKPTGSGTGLGLSLSYDIVKVHGGEIKVQSKEAEKTTFLIQLPI